MTEDARFDENALPRLGRMVGEDVLAEVLDLYTASAPARMAAVQEGLDSNELDLASRTLHDLKSSAGMVGALGVNTLAEEMEQLARAGDRDELRARMPRLESAIATTAQTLAAARERRGI
jgi:HPt (histidine-containing phosphotransfer) domain-containing protein